MMTTIVLTKSKDPEVEISNDPNKQTTLGSSQRLEDLGVTMAVSHEKMMQARERVRRFEKDLSNAKEVLFEMTKDWEKVSADLRCAMDEVSVDDVMGS